MDLRAFYQKMRKIEQEITAPHVVMVSIETPDGGKAGVRTEVNRESAAKLIVEGRSRLATPEEADEFHRHMRASIREREKAVLTSRLNINILSDDEMATIRKSVRKQDQ